VTDRGRAWPEALPALRHDPWWLGGDDAYSIPLAGGRRLWLFGDTFVASRPGGDRTDAAFIHNSVAIQDGDDPETASLTFTWRGEAGAPTSFIPDEDDGTYHWPGHGAVVDGRLVLFTMRVRDRDTVPPDEVETLVFFEVVGWDAFLVADPAGEAAAWTLQRCGTFATEPGAMIGSGGVLAEGEWLYAHRWQDRQATALRWPIDAAAAGDLTGPQWWAGEGEGWQADAQRAVATVPDAQTEFTVHREPSGRYALIEASGLFTASIRARSADRLTGPWSAPRPVFSPPRAPEAFSYAGKAHPGLAAKGLAVTYNTIPTTIEAIRHRPDVYVPRVVRLDTDPDGNLL